MKLLVLVGSLRAGSFNAQLARAAQAHLPAGVTASTYAGLVDLPFYSEDLDVEPVPSQVDDFRRAVREADALLVATPEYNGSISGVLKNAIDWVSRPRDDAPLAGKPTAVIAASAAPSGAQWARDDALRILGVAGARVVSDTVGVGSAYEVFGGGRLDHDQIDQALADLVGQLTTREPIAA